MEGEMAVLHFARALVGMSLRATMASRAAFAVQVTFMALNNLTFFVFWWLLLDRVPSVRGWALDDIEALFGVAATSVGLVQVMTGGVRWLGRTIDSGALDSILVQPK